MNAPLSMFTVILAKAGIQAFFGHNEVIDTNFLSWIPAKSMSKKSFGPE